MTFLLPPGIKGLRYSFEHVLRLTSKHYIFTTKVFTLKLLAGKSPAKGDFPLRLTIPIFHPKLSYHNFVEL